MMRMNSDNDYEEYYGMEEELSEGVEEEEEEIEAAQAIHGIQGIVEEEVFALLIFS